MMDWWDGFFDQDYLRLWEGADASERTAREIEGLVSLLNLQAGTRVLDAPCGYGRISRPLAERGAIVLGVDWSPELLEEAEKRRGDLTVERLRYERHDLRTPLRESGFDVALNLFSSIGYGSESDDLAILSHLRDALRPGGQLFVETMHRDRIVANLAQNPSPCHRLPDGTLFMEEPRFDPIAGRVETTWYWNGPAGAGRKTASIRAYTATELVRLIEAARLRVRSTHDGCSSAPFVAPGAGVGGRLGVLAVRE